MPGKHKGSDEKALPQGGGLLLDALLLPAPGQPLIKRAHRRWWSNKWSMSRMRSPTAGFSRHARTFLLATGGSFFAASLNSQATLISLRRLARCRTSSGGSSRRRLAEALAIPHYRGFAQLVLLRLVATAMGTGDSGEGEVDARRGHPFRPSPNDADGRFQLGVFCLC